MYSTVHIVYTLQIFSGQWAVGHQYQLSDSVIVETVMQVFYMKIWFSQPYSDSPYTNSEAYSGIIKVPLHNKDSGRQKENLKAILSVIYRQDNSISRAGILWPLKPVVVVAASQATIVDILSKNSETQIEECDAYNCFSTESAKSLEISVLLHKATILFV